MSNFNYSSPCNTAASINISRSIEQRIRVLNSPIYQVGLHDFYLLICQQNYPPQSPIKHSHLWIKQQTVQKLISGNKLANIHCSMFECLVIIKQKLQVWTTLSQQNLTLCKLRTEFQNNSERQWSTSAKPRQQLLKKNLNWIEVKSRVMKQEISWHVLKSQLINEHSLEWLEFADRCGKNKTYCWHQPLVIFIRNNRIDYIVWNLSPPTHLPLKDNEYEKDRTKL